MEYKQKKQFGLSEIGDGKEPWRTLKKPKEPWRTQKKPKKHKEPWRTLRNPKETWFHTVTHSPLLCGTQVLDLTGHFCYLILQTLEVRERRGLGPNTQSITLSLLSQNRLWSSRTFYFSSRPISAQSVPTAATMQSPHNP